VKWAGAYPCHCTLHVSFGMRGVVVVPVVASPASGHVGTRFTIRLASVAAPAGFAYDVQRRKGTGPWKAFKTGVVARSVMFTAGAKGKFSFRSRLRKKSTGAASGYSPPDTVSVT
jgi:hypothetical protein